MDNRVTIRAHGPQVFDMGLGINSRTGPTRPKLFRTFPTLLA